MPLTCNIDQHGAKVRRVWGTFALLIATLLAALAWWSGSWWLWPLVAAAYLAGAFALFEAKKKWCALRALGIKTPT